MFIYTLIHASKSPTYTVKLYTAVPSDHRCRNIGTSLVAVSNVSVAAILGRSRPACLQIEVNEEPALFLTKSRPTLSEYYSADFMEYIRGEFMCNRW